MIASLYLTEDDLLTGIIADGIDSEVGEILCTLSKEITESPITLEQLNNCECYGLLFLDDETIGYFFMIKGNIQIKLMPNKNNNDLIIKCYNIVINNMKIYYPQLLETYPQQCPQFNIKIKRVPA